MKLMLGLATRGYDLMPSTAVFIHEMMVKYGAVFNYRVCGFDASIAQEFVFRSAAESNIDYLLMFDSDVIIPPSVVEKLIAADKDLITAPIFHYSAFNGLIHLNVAKDFGAYIFNPKAEGVEEMLIASFGCLLIKKKVLDAFVEHKECFSKWSPILDDDLQGNSSDSLFFMKARKFGFPLYVSWDAQGCSHYTRVHLSVGTISKLMQNIGAYENGEPLRTDLPKV